MFYIVKGAFQLNQLSISQILNLLTGSIDLNNCLGNCSQNGLCKYAQNTFFCSCNAYFAGPGCSIDIRPCSLNPCMNNGTCVEDLSDLLNITYFCDCDLNYYGASCEYKKDVCQNETCSNNGKCIDFNNQAKCECFSLFDGSKCEIQSEALKTIKMIISITSLIAIAVVISFYLIVIASDIINYLMKLPKHRNKKDPEKPRTRPKYVKYKYIN